MKPLTLFLFALLLTSSIACKKEKDPELQITVLTDNGPAADFNLNISSASGKTISKTTDKDGKIIVQLEANKEYHIIRDFNTTNFASVYIGNTEATYLTKGNFTSQQEINNYPRQTPAATIGGPRYADINGDGAIDEYDLVLPVTTTASEEMQVVVYLKNKL